MRGVWVERERFVLRGVAILLKVWYNSDTGERGLGQFDQWWLWSIRSSLLGRRKRGINSIGDYRKEAEKVSKVSVASLLHVHAVQQWSLRTLSVVPCRHFLHSYFIAQAYLGHKVLVNKPRGKFLYNVMFFNRLFIIIIIICFKLYSLCLLLPTPPYQTVRLFRRPA